MKSFLTVLLERHVPQVAGLYIAAVWALVQFADWAVDEYVLSPHLPGFIFALGLLFLPSVALVAWRLGDAEEGASWNLTIGEQPLARPPWKKRDSAGVLLNIALASTVLFIGYGGKELRSATNTVRLTDDTGETVQVEVPRSAFLKELLIFHFDDDSADGDLGWMSYASTLALEADLAQDPFVAAYAQWNNWYDFQGELSEAGYQRGTGIPLALKRQTAEKLDGLDFFLAGSVGGDSSRLVLTTELYETRTGRLVAEREFPGYDLLALVDEAAVQVRRDLEIPDYRLESATDLPVREVLTSSTEALREAAGAYYAESVGRFDDATRGLEAAVAADSTFAWAQWSLAYQYLHDGRREAADSTIEDAMRYRYRLPQRRQLSMQAGKYAHFDEEFERALRTAKYMVEVFPHDIESHYTLLGLNQASGNRAGTIRAAEAVLELNPSDYAQHLFIGQQLELDGDYERAIEHYERYTEAVPQERYGYLFAADVYRILGQHDAAAAAYDRAEVATSDEPHVLVDRAYHELGLGNVETAREYRDRAAGMAATAQERVRLATFDETFFWRLGRYAEAVEAYERSKEATVGQFTPLNEALVLGKSVVLQHAAEAGRAEWAIRELDAYEASMPSPYDALNARTFLYIYLDLRDTVRARTELERANAVMETLGMGTERAAVEYGRGRIAEIAGDCARALDHYRSALDIVATNIDPLLATARCEQALGQWREAETTLSTILRRVPAYPLALAQLAYLYRTMGREDEALAQLDAALEMWRDADPEYLPAQRARQALAELQ